MKRNGYYYFFLIILSVFVVSTQYSQAIVREHFLIYSPLMQLIIFIFAWFLIIRFNRKTNSPFLLLFILWMVYLIIRFFFSGTGHDQKVSVFRYSWYCTCFIAAYLSSLNVKKRIQIAKPFFIILFIVAIGLTLFQLSLGELVIATSNNEGILVTNIVFWTLCLFPFIFLLQNLNVQLLLLLSGSLVILMTMKRSALIAEALILILFVRSILWGGKQFKSSQKKFVIGLLIILIGVAYFTYSSQLGSLFGMATERFKSIEETDGNNRIPLWADCIKAIKSSNAIEFLFGHGFNSTLPVTGHTSCHNDFLTLLLELGLVAVFFYLTLIINIIKRIYYTKKYRTDLHNIYVSIFIILLSVGLVGDLFTCYTYLGLMTAILGIIEADLLKPDSPKVNN